MPFATEAEQIRKFENDEVAQHYFEVLRTLISKKPFFAQQVGLKEVANYLGKFLQLQEPKSKLMIATQPFCDCQIFLAKS